MSGSPILNQGKFFEASNFLQQNIAYNAGGNAEYIGHAAPGSSDSAAAWRIQKLTYNASGNVTAIRFADSSIEFGKVWDDRLAYSY